MNRWGIINIMFNEAIANMIFKYLLLNLLKLLLVSITFNRACFKKLYP